MSEREARVVIYPPRKPLEFPLFTNEVCNLIGISRSTFFRWEDKGLIPVAPQRLVGGQIERAYNPQEVVSLLKAMQKHSNTDGSAKHKWLQGIDLENPENEIITISGYEIFLK